MLDTIKLDLSNAEASTHRVNVQLASGAYDQTDSRFWDLAGGKLKAGR
jgi:hypothetical protein